MNNLLVRYVIRTNRDAVVLAGDYINVYWDDVNSTFVVHHFDDENDTTETVLTSGPDLGADRFDHEPVTSVSPIPYSFCSGADLQTFTRKSTFPYATKVSTANHFSCVSSVCDLQISDDFTIQPASGSTTADGAFQVSATSSNGTIKFSLDPNFNYSTDGQESGLFSGYLPGEYTITAKDALGCVDQITIAVPVTDAYGVKYRADYKDVNGIPSRVDILERAFSGAITEIETGEDPFILKLDGQGELNKFYPIMASMGITTLWSPSNFYFRNLFTQDERKYQKRFYKDFGATTGGFTPATLDGLSLWTNVAGPDYDWTTGATPTITFTSSPRNSKSDFLRTLYTFVAGRTYTFDYNFEATGYQGSGAGHAAATFEIAILDASNNVLINKFVNVSPLTTGTYIFLAPNGAVAIGVRVHLSPAVSDQRYRINSYTNQTATEGAGGVGLEIKWLGYLISGHYAEPYIKDPYPVSITATDGLADLKNYDFLDKDGNKYRDDLITINAIAEILAKTDLGLNIQIVINRYETTMAQTATDDPLKQCKFNPETFYHDGKVMNCHDVLQEIIKPFGGVIKQRLGKWFIYNPEELVTSAEYREFDKNGVFISNGTINDIIDIRGAIFSSRAVMEGGGQMLEVVPAYGKLFFEHTLLKHASLIKSYSFEPEDIYTDSNGLKLFKNWNVNIANAPGATYGIKKTKALEGDYNFYLKYLLLRGSGTNVASGVSVLSAPITIEYEDVDAFEFRFSYACLLSEGSFGNVYWIKLKWMLQVGSYYYNETGGWTTDINQKYNEIYVERFNEVLEKKVTALLRDVAALTTESAMVEFILCNAFVYDFEDTTALKNTPTTTKAIGNRMKVKSSASLMHYYILEEGTDAESIPSIVRPIDYAAGTNERIWKAEHLSVSSRGREVEFNYLDNVVLLHFPDGAEPADDITIERENNSGIKIDLEMSYLLNDIDTVNINNSEQTYKNYFKLLSGTPTQTWARSYRAGQGKLLDLLSNDVVSQYKSPSNKITGSFLIDREVITTTILNEAGDSNRKYQFMGYALHDKHATIDFDIVELKDAVTDPTSDAVDAGFTTGFTLGFRS